MKTFAKNLYRMAVVLLGLCLLTACLFESGGGTAAAPPITGTVSGLVVAVTDVSSPIYGAKVEVPDDALLSPSETVTIGYTDTLPAALTGAATTAEGVTASKVILLTRSSTTDFGKAVTVTIPYSTATVPADTVPIVVVYDEASGTYSAVTVLSVDPVAGLIKFATSHFSKYHTQVLKKVKKGAASVDLSVNVGFTPGADGFFIHNFGSYDSPGGNSFAMSAYAAWFYKYKKSTHGAGLYGLYREGSAALEEDDQNVRELIVRTYQATDQKSHITALNWATSQTATSTLTASINTGLTLISQMKATDEPQIMVMGIGTNGNWSKGQAVVVYAYSDQNNKFKYYDPNFPNEVLELPWDSTNGFTNPTVKNVTWELFAPASFNQALSTTTLEALYAGVESGWTGSTFPEITITAPAALTTTSSTHEVATATNVLVQGSVPRAVSATNPTAQRYVHVYLNGAKYGSAVAVGNTDNAFSFTIAQLPSASGTDVMLLVSESPYSWGSTGFSAFRQFKIRIPSLLFFQNFGFENGTPGSTTFSDWMSELHTWSNSNQTIPSPDSLIVSSGFDPIATDLPVTLFGQQAARINNQQNGARISSLAQTAVVPSASNPVIKFSWAAVLQDPNHSPQEQPYVEVVVRNVTKGVDLYVKKFYANDPTYSGWLSYQGGSWKAISWQAVEIPVSQYVGDTISIKVEAADCEPSGHGGYAYLDAEE